MFSFISSRIQTKKSFKNLENQATKNKKVSIFSSPFSLIQCTEFKISRDFYIKCVLLVILITDPSWSVMIFLFLFREVNYNSIFMLSWFSRIFFHSSDKGQVP